MGFHIDTPFLWTRQAHFTGLPTSDYAALVLRSLAGEGERYAKGHPLHGGRLLPQPKPLPTGSGNVGAVVRALTVKGCEGAERSTTQRVDTR